MKQALLIGINYKGSTGELNGCINDVVKVREYLMTKGYKDENIIICTEETNVKPTRTSILRLLSQLVFSDSSTLYFHYSGHGSYITDSDGDELDGKDECLVPLDYQISGMITDDNIRSIFSLMDPGKHLNIVLDCCHSGTGIDLGYNLYKRLRSYCMVRDNNYPITKSSIIMISGCQDVQTSADAYIDGKYQGALTNAYIKVMSENARTYEQLINRIRTILEEGEFDQLPNLSSGKPLNLKSKIII